MNTETARIVLDAGGVIPASLDIESEIPLDPVAARTYAHPGLAEPVVLVDLSALAPARDIEMEILGFEDPGDLGQEEVIGKRPRRALGFPGTAIVSDPDNAGYALEVVKEFRKAARRAQSKPGHAKTAIDAIGDRLGKSVPHFLPSFYEEACRVFLEAGNVTYAGQMFEKARVAERVHALDVDETLRENTFVEFALAGALSIKSLTNYAKELAESAEPEDAYQTFRRVCIKRTLGGLPPWAKMAAELKRLARAAGKDIGAEEQAVLAEIIEAPALAKAAAGFWKPYGKSLAALAKEQPAIRKQLLELFPSVSAGVWLELLDSCGALAGVTDPDAAAEVKPGGTVGAWFERLASFASGWRDSVPARGFELLEQAAPILRGEGAPLNLFGRYDDGDLDFIELAFQLEIPLVDPPDNARFGYLPSWAESAGEPHRGRDPIGIAGDARYAPLLASAIDSYLGGEPLTTLALERDGFRGAIGSWLERRLDAVESGGALPDLYDTIKTLQSQATGKVWTAFPEQLARLESCSVAPALLETVRIGLFDEIGWAVFDEVIDRFPAGAELTICGPFPRVVVSDGSRAVVVGPREVIAEIDLQLPAGATVQGFRWAQDQLMVIFRPADSWEPHAYWSGDPGEVFPLEGSYYSYGTSGAVAVVLDDGSVVTDGAAFCAGDRKVSTGSAISDGESFWVAAGDWSDRHFRELDPRTGKLGRRSAPPFFESYSRDGMKLYAYSFSLYPLPDGVTGCVLGQDGPMVGLRTRLRDHESPLADSVPLRECERADGKGWSETDAASRELPEALISLPGDDAVRPVFTSWRSMSIVSPDAWVVGSTNNINYRRGTRSLAPLTWWGGFEARDPAGSEALRQITAEQAAALIAAGAAAREAAERDEDSGKPVFAFEGTPLAEAVQTIFGGAITHPRLCRGVGGIAFMAAGDAERLGALVESATAAAGEAGAELPVDPPALAAAVSDFGNFTQGSRGIAEIAAVGHLFDELADGEVSVQPIGAGADWESMLGARAALAYRCISDVTSPEARAALLDLLDAFAQSALAEKVAETRMIRVAKSPDPVSPADQIFAFRQGASRYFGWHHYDKSATLLEWAEGGQFQLPGGGESITSDTRPYSSWGSTGDIAALRARLDESGPVDFAPLAAAVAAATGHTETEALRLITGLNAADNAIGARYPKIKSRALELAGPGVSVSAAQRIAVLGDPVIAGWQEAWTDPEGFAARVAAAWNQHCGQMAPISETVAEQLAAAKLVGRPTAALRTFADPGRGELATDGTWALDADNDMRITTEGQYFDDDTLEMSAALIPYLALYAPVGAPARAKIPEALAAIRARLENPALWLSLGSVYWDDDSKRDEFLASFGGDKITGPKGPLEMSAQRDGMMILPNRYGHEIHVRPVALRDHPDEITRLSALTYWTPGWVTTARVFFSGDYDKLAARIAETPVPEGGYEGNPIVSAPGLVETVGNALDLDQNAAALYLQLAALPAPKDKLIRAWNGWSARVHKAAQKALVDRGLALEARRARAGRNAFVPGGWEALKSPLTPLESWKLPLYGIGRDEDGAVRVPHSEILPLAPIHEVFEAAWSRIDSGDKPRYEEPGK